MNTMTVFKIIAISAVLAISSGCSTMNTSMKEFGYGKLYAMQDALRQATENCSDQETRQRAMNWVVIGIQDLTASTEFMAAESEEKLYTRTLIGELSKVTSRRNKTEEVLCANLASAYTAARSYMVAMNYASDVMMASK
ncbi:MAG: hypothetical protein AB1810_01540 [Pseudomonadota bacterium]